MKQLLCDSEILNEIRELLTQWNGSMITDRECIELIWKINNKNL